jgi:hypothetical protein
MGHVSRYASAGTIENQDPRVNFPHVLHVQNWSLRILRPVAEVPYCSTLAKAQQKQRRWQLLTAGGNRPINGGFLWGKSWKTPKF